MIKGSKVTARKERLSAVEAIQLCKQIKILAILGHSKKEIAKLLDIKVQSVYKYLEKDLGDL